LGLQDLDLLHQVEPERLQLLHEDLKQADHLPHPVLLCMAPTREHLFDHVPCLDKQNVIKRSGKRTRKKKKRKKKKKKRSGM
jgi:hypothetical protein